MRHWYNRESERATANLGNCFGLLLGAVLHQHFGWMAVFLGASLAFVLGGWWMVKAAKRQQEFERAPGEAVRSASNSTIANG